MTHYQEWLLKGKVVYVKFWDDISVDELGVAFAKSSDLAVASETPPVHFLHNWGEVTSFPMKLHQLRRMTQNVKGDSRRVGWVVVFGTENIIMRFLGDVFFQMFRVRFRMFPTSQEAIDFLKRIDATIDDIPQIPEVTPTYQPPQPNISDDLADTKASEPIASIGESDENLMDTNAPTTPDESKLLDTDAPTSADIKLPIEPLPEDEEETRPVDTVKQADTTETPSVEASTNSDD